jgi:hypothetical protein
LTQLKNNFTLGAKSFAKLKYHDWCDRDNIMLLKVVPCGVHVEQKTLICKKVLIRYVVGWIQGITMERNERNHISVKYTLKLENPIISIRKNPPNLLVFQV